MKREKRNRFGFFLILILGFMSTAFMPGNEFTDKEITNAVDSKLSLNATTPSFLIDIETNEGIVTLSGTVNDLLVKDRAIKIARTVKGVRAVVDNMEVDAPARTDRELKRDVEDALLDDPATDAYEVTVEAVNGYVTLQGTVESWQEKKLSEYVAKGVIGVKGVNNKIDVEYVSDRSDLEIKQEIKQSLANDVRIDDGLIEVAVNDGDVDLSGTVGSANEQYLASRNAWVTGVQSVDTGDLKVKSWARDDAMRKDKYVVKTDREVKDAVRDAFFYDPRVSPAAITVSVEDGIITLTGEVDNLKAKRAAERDAKNVVGVFGVNNHINVRPVFIPENKALQKDVEAALRSDPIIEQWELDVKANNGVVYLNGTVDSYFEKLQAEDVASKTKGVVAVENNIETNDDNDFYNYNYYGWNTLFPPVQVDVDDSYKSDEEIKTSTLKHIYWSPYLDRDEVEVSVSNRIAVLEGTVETRREKVFAEIYAMKGGAEEVINNIEVEYSN